MKILARFREKHWKTWKMNFWRKKKLLIVLWYDFVLRLFFWIFHVPSKKKIKALMANPEYKVCITVNKIWYIRWRMNMLPFPSRFHDFHSPPLDDADFDAKPMILLVGQYSTGKTTFIRYLLEQDFPGIRIGPEPTTDCFIIITKVETSTWRNVLFLQNDNPIIHLNWKY